MIWTGLCLKIGETSGHKKIMRSRSAVFLAFAFETSYYTSVSFHLNLRDYAGGIVFSEINHDQSLNNQ